MKKLSILTAFTSLLSGHVMAADIKLPEPKKDNQVTLMETLSTRHSVRKFQEKEIDLQTLSNILWVAYGVNRQDGKRTIPTALNEQDLSIYTADKNGVWLYDAQNNILKQQSQKNLLPLFNTQEYMQNVPLVLIYTGSKNEHQYAIMHAGSAYQNVSLYAAATDLGCVVRGFFDAEQVAKELNLPKNQHVIISQAIGYEVK